MFRGIDFFSDTVTRPSVAMRQFMVNAEVGNEMEGEDPTTLELEVKVAMLLGKETALFLPSATMANQIAIQALCERGDELIAAETAHVFFAECGGPAANGGAQAKPIPSTNGLFTASDVEERYRWSPAPWSPQTGLVSVENTTNIGGGWPWPLEQLREVITLSRKLGLKLHLDGARLFNAAVASQVSVEELASPFDTVTLCLSKGLGCPVGAVLAFDQDRFTRIRRLKQRMGGALRQSGILAAAGLYALEHHCKRLEEDHQNAAYLANVLNKHPQIEVENTEPSTNMVFFSWKDETLSWEAFHQRCLDRHLRFSMVGKNRFRAVTHLDVSRNAIDEAKVILESITEEQ